MMQQQTTEEMTFVYEYWAKNLAPKGYVDNLANTNTIVEEILRRGIAVVTFALLTDVAQVLGDKANGGKLEFKRTAAPTTAQEAAEKKADWKRNPRQPNTVDVNSERDEFVEDLNNPESLLFFKLQNEAQHEVEKAINDCVYQNNRGRIDWPLTNQRRDVLRTIKVLGKNGKGQNIVLWTETLAKIQTQLRQFDRDDRQRDYVR